MTTDVNLVTSGMETPNLEIRSIASYVKFDRQSRVIENVISGLKEWLLQLPDVVEAPHSFGGTEYQVYGREFMHTHGPRYLDIHLSREDQELVLREGKAERHQFTPARAGWVTFHIRSDGDVETAKELITLAYNDARKITAFRKQRLSSG